ncbi:hypothetical protein C9374_004041 [Naegleria lovaniensis]|uniref:Uncharacterized protein n=1 Tax=Naegleria lovaniensis TaxID=51637 RepID=A0AA88H978_NAELO|nr:uncharacterized protein C9374_004041 [Naegleria lovaniensis]KAG2394277.1 hypothetical protein C9374_004041 [Naegleria lovaniensis]
MRKRAPTVLSTNQLPAASTHFQDVTVQLLSQETTSPLQLNIAAYFSRMNGPASCRSCGERSKKLLFTFGDNIYCKRCASDMERVYLQSYRQREEMRERGKRVYDLCVEMESKKNSVNSNASSRAQSPVMNSSVSTLPVMNVMRRASIISANFPELFPGGFGTNGASSGFPSPATSVASSLVLNALNQQQQQSKGLSQ